MNQQTLEKKWAKWIGEQAKNALLAEVYTTPKPGLVDTYSNGAHKDMDLRTFERSAEALEPFFEEMAECGMEHAKDPELCFQKIRGIGMRAETAMYEATNHVNTHKGMIFSIGILSAAAGICMETEQKITMEELFVTEQKMVREILLEELEEIERKSRDMERQKNTISHGVKLYLERGVTGVRGEALSGFASVRNWAYPILKEELAAGTEENHARIQALFSLMSHVGDTNVLSRTGETQLREMQRQANEFLKAGGMHQAGAEDILKKMDAEYTAKNISPGGCADLLAIAVFLYHICDTKTLECF